MISSRTPEGLPSRCPVCGSEVRAEPAALFGDAPCPRCGSLLWFIALPSGTRLFDQPAAEEFRNRVADLAEERLGVNKDTFWTNPFFEGDSLDLYEVLLEMDEEFHLFDWSR